MANPGTPTLDQLRIFLGGAHRQAQTIGQQGVKASHVFDQDAAGLQLGKDRVRLGVQDLEGLVHVDAVHLVLKPLSIPCPGNKEQLEACILAQTTSPLLFACLLLCCERACALVRTVVAVTSHQRRRALRRGWPPLSA